MIQKIQMIDPRDLKDAHDHSFNTLAYKINELVVAFNSLPHSTDESDCECKCEVCEERGHHCGNDKCGTVTDLLSPSAKSELNFCSKCVQMTNHNDTTCLKCGVSEISQKTEIESLSSKFHDIYQKEAIRQAGLGIDKVRHPDRYEDLPERTKEYDRVLARYVLSLLSQAIREERERVQARIREMFREGEMSFDVGSEHSTPRHYRADGYNQALQDILSLLNTTEK